MKKRPEILAPAGNINSFCAAVNAGADAIYVGGTKFGARAYASNFTTSELVDAIRYAHLHNVKVYLTTNTLIKNTELKNEYFSYIKPLYEAGLDALIVQDLGVMSYIKEFFPNIDIHASTQCTLFTHYSANQLKSLYNITRVVPPRELSFTELKEYRGNTDLELEVFIHGALCYCYSGKCLMSSANGGRSGNRGRCAQPCRHEYKFDNTKEYALSPKDLCSLKYIDRLIECGIDSFKIEGRMKKPEYVALCVMIYKKYIDKYFELGKEKYLEYINSHTSEFEVDIDKLTDIYNRGGFTDGYFYKHNGAKMISNTKPNHFGNNIGKVIKATDKNVEIKLSKNIGAHDVLEIRGKKDINTYEFTTKNSLQKGDILRSNILKGKKISPQQLVYRTRNQNLIDNINTYIINNKKKKQINMSFIAKVDEQATLTIYDSDVSITAMGDYVQAASNTPLDKDRIQKQLLKLGETDFSCYSCEIVCDSNIFIPMSAINNLRRQALADFIRKINEKYERETIKEDNFSIDFDKTLIDKHSIANSTIKYTVEVDNLDYIDKLLDLKNISQFILPLYSDLSNMTTIISKLQAKDKTVIINFPEIIRYNYYENIKKKILKISQIYDNIIFCCNSLEAISIANECNIDKSRLIAGSNLYAFNNKTVEYLSTLTNSIILPYELSYEELTAHNCANSYVRIYGKLPVMFSAQCVQKNFKKCNKGFSTTTITDLNETDISYDVKCNCDWCYNTIYSKIPFDNSHHISDYQKLSIENVVISLIDISNADFERVIQILSLDDSGYIKNNSNKNHNNAYSYFKNGVI